MNKQFFITKSRADLERCYPVIRELRPHLSFEDYLKIYEDAHSRDGYEIVAIEDVARLKSRSFFAVADDGERADPFVVQGEVLAAARGDEELATCVEKGSNRGRVLDQPVAKPLVGEVDDWNDSARRCMRRNLTPLRR